MTALKRRWITTGIISIVLFITGKLIFKPLFTFFEPRIDGIVFRIRELDNIVKTSTLFSVLLAVIPAMLLSVWTILPVNSVIKRLGSILVILSFMTVGVIARHGAVKGYFTNVIRPWYQQKGQTSVDYPIDPVNFVYYMSVGFCIGLLISCFVFRDRRELSAIAHSSI